MDDALVDSFAVPPEGGQGEALFRFGQEDEPAPVTVRWHDDSDPSTPADHEVEAGDATNVIDLAASNDAVWLLVSTTDWEEGWRVVGLGR